ncbi:hypothetical protein D082_17990 [Synechocystis sp. PCC 6714]|nr:hypothetical protein D082_17990 [Synechocystis sp. PCC 6714]
MLSSILAIAACIRFESFLVIDLVTPWVMAKGLPSPRNKCKKLVGFSQI